MTRVFHAIFSSHWAGFFGVPPLDYPTAGVEGGFFLWRGCIFAQLCLLAMRKARVSRRVLFTRNMPCICYSQDQVGTKPNCTLIRLLFGNNVRVSCPNYGSLLSSYFCPRPTEDSSMNKQERPMRHMDRDLRGAVVVINNHIVSGKRDDTTGPLAVDVLAESRVYVRDDAWRAIAELPGTTPRAMTPNPYQEPCCITATRYTTTSSPPYVPPSPPVRASS